MRQKICLFLLGSLLFCLPAFSMGSSPALDLPSINNKISINEKNEVILEKDAYIQDASGRTYEPKAEEKIVRIYNKNGDLEKKVELKYAPEDILVLNNSLYVTETNKVDGKVFFLIEEFNLSGKKLSDLSDSLPPGRLNTGRAAVIDACKNGDVLVVIGDEKEGLTEIWAFKPAARSWQKVFKQVAKKGGKP